MDDAPPRFTKTRKRREVARQARYLTFSCQHQLALFGNDAIKRAFVEHMEETRRATHFRLFAWVIMPEHVHLLVLPELPESPISVVLRQLKGGFANRVLRRWRELNAPILARLVDPIGKTRFWLPGGGYDRNTLLDTELGEKIGYIHRNPVVRGLARDPLDYEWSSAQWYSNRMSNALLRIDSYWERFPSGAGATAGKVGRGDAPVAHDS